jgi:hypothetical protein
LSDELIGLGVKLVGLTTFNQKERHHHHHRDRPHLQKNKIAWLGGEQRTTTLQIQHNSKPNIYFKDTIE